MIRPPLSPPDDVAWTGRHMTQAQGRHATTCSAVCLGWTRLKKKGREKEVRSRADPPDALWREMKRRKDRT
jgi:hypothetical protein